MPNSKPHADFASLKDQTECCHKNPPKTKARNDDANFVKVIVFDEENRILAVKNKSGLILPGGQVEWDDDDAETAARREVFEAANIALGLVLPVTAIKTKDNKKEITKTVVFTARTSAKEQGNPNQKRTHRFFSKQAFIDTICHRSELVCRLVDDALKILVSEEIKEDHDQTTLRGREKYNHQSIL